MLNTTRVFINTLNANEVFMFPGENTRMVCESRRSEGGYTTVEYRVAGTNERFTYTRPGLSTVDIALD